MNIPLSKPDIGEREIEYVARVLLSGRLSMGPMLDEFEARFADYIGTRYAVATNSGTSALHLIVTALGIGPQDEVLTSSFSFAASVNCLLYEGALPVFVDIDPATLNLDPAEIRKILARDYLWDRTKKSLVNQRSGRVLKAILPVHVFGLPCPMDEILETAREFDLRVIEDACEALGAECCGRRTGTFGDAAAFAFYANKQITTAEGGMIVTDSPAMARLCRSLRNQGRDDDAGWLRHVRLGYNYRLSEMHCALGLAQLERIDELLAARERVAALYSRALTGIPEIEPPANLPGARRSWFVYVIRLRGTSAAAKRDALMAALKDRGIPSRPYFPAIHRQPYFREFCLAPSRRLLHTDAASERCLALPFFSSMTERQVSEVSGAVREILSEARTPVGAVPDESQEASSLPS